MERAPDGRHPECHCGDDEDAVHVRGCPGLVEDCPHGAIDLDTGECTDCGASIACIGLTSTTPRSPTVCGERVTPLRVPMSSPEPPRGVAIHPACNLSPAPRRS